MTPINENWKNIYNDKNISWKECKIKLKLRNGIFINKDIKIINDN
jgi:hypothetical protein